MSRWIPMLAIVAACTTGCSTVYRVHVNGYCERAEPVAQDACIYVVADPNAQNPIFQREVKRKMERLLEDYGYACVEAKGAADYLLGFQVGMDSEKAIGYTPIHGMYGGYSGGHHWGYGLGYTAYVPYYDTWYDPWLVTRLLAANRDEAGPEDVIWVGEAMMSTSRAELREAVNYLLVGCIEYLGLDTAERVTLTIKRNDPRIASIIAETHSGARR